MDVAERWAWGLEMALQAVYKHNNACRVLSYCTSAWVAVTSSVSRVKHCVEHVALLLLLLHRVAHELALLSITRICCACSLQSHVCKAHLQNLQPLHLAQGLAKLCFRAEALRCVCMPTGALAFYTNHTPVVMHCLSMEPRDWPCKANTRHVGPVGPQA
jgi:hypothetical protein